MSRPVTWATVSRGLWANDPASKSRHCARDRRLGRSRSLRVAVLLAGTLVISATVGSTAALATLTAPVISTPTTGTTQVALSWSASSGEPVTAYEVLRGKGGPATEKVAFTDGYTTNFLDTERQSAGHYTYKVVAKGKATSA